MKNNLYVYIYIWISFLYNRNKQVINQLFFSKTIFLKKKPNWLEEVNLDLEFEDINNGDDYDSNNDTYCLDCAN